ncbi:MAG: arsenate reductase family protein [Candidatus Protochlamydia sp.]|nr:arsenate reductase family protein [Candidatus Protochlamydia sp.]
MILFIYSKCSTCKNALRFLENNHIQFVPKEIVIEPPSVQQLKDMLNFMEGNVKKLFNSYGQLYRELGLHKLLGKMPIADTLILLSQNGMLVKRPFLLAKDFGLTGFNEIDWTKKMLPKVNYT